MKVTLTGYADRLVVKPGEQIRFMVHAEGTDQADVQLVRLLHGDENPAGPGFLEEAVASPIDGLKPVGEQHTQVGSFIRVADEAGHLNLEGAFTLWAYIWPTTPSSGRQGLLTRWSNAHQCGYGLGINEQSQLEFWVGDGQRTDAVHVDVTLIRRHWYLVAAAFDPASQLASLSQLPIQNRYSNQLSRVAPIELVGSNSRKLANRSVDAGCDFLWAGFHDRTADMAVARDHVSGLFNGKIDRCGVMAGAMDLSELARFREGEAVAAKDCIAHWDTTAGYTDAGIGDEVIDIGPQQLHGKGYNRPVRGATGYNWNGRDDCFRLAPEQYGGIWFHDDAIIDCCWAASFQMTVPELKSGVYAARLHSDDVEDHVPFFVRPQKPAAAVAMLMPTCTYLAYANERLGLTYPGAQVVNAHTPIFHEWDLELARRQEFGSSTYDRHSDGGGICYSSHLRPVLNMRPKHRMAGTVVPWAFPADLSILCWLELSGYEYDLITDEDLHREGEACLSPYRVVLNATHAEYYTEPMMDATEDYLAGGGRLMYLSGNGYYWVAAFRDGDPTCVEVRKLESGSRAWQALPGEHYMASNGERSGIWRNRGRAPQKLVGTGFSAEGFDQSMPYRRMPDGYDDAVAWIFAGVDKEVFGDFGLALGGAAGIELDRYDLSLGTPPNARILASSEGHSDNYQKVVEEVLFNFPGQGGTQHYHVRADMVYFGTPNDGAVWSASSIAWGQALPWNNCDNDVARITGNVLNAFLKEGPLPGTQS